MHWNWIVVTAFVVACAGCDSDRASRSDRPTEAAAASIVLHNGRIVTADADFTTATALAISGDRIIAVGTDRDVLDTAVDATRIIDLEGRTVIPGLIDSHIHAMGYGLHISQHVMFSTGERLNVAAMLEIIAGRAAESATGEWIYVRGPYSLDFIEEGRLPNREELDSVTRENPVFINTQGHIGVVNSKALEIAGVAEDTPDPPNGVYMRDPETGRLTGTMYEFPTFTPFLKHIPPHSIEARMEAARQANRDFSRLGITTVVNLWAEPENLAVLKRLQEAGELSVRWSMVYRLSPEAFAGKPYSEVEAMIRELGATGDSNDDWVTVDGVKIIYDGFAEAAYMHEPYLEDMFGPGWHGVAFWDADSLKAVMQACLENDLQVFVHVAGDRALDDVLDAMTAVNEVGRIPGRRWTLEHASTMPSDNNLQVVRRLGLIVSTQQAMGWSIGKTFKRFWGEQRGGTFAPNRTWLDGLGHPYVKGGSDNRPVNPFIGIWSYLLREDVDGVVGNPDETLELEDTLRLYTSSGAYGIFEEESRGSLETGKLADLVILPVDLFDMPVDDIRSIEPDMTIVGGKVQFQRADMAP